MSNAIALCLFIAALFLMSDLLITISTERQRIDGQKINSTNKKHGLSVERILFFPSLDEIKDAFNHNERFRWRGLAYIELVGLGIWAIILGAVYLNFDPQTVPGGPEFGSAIPSHHFWLNLKECGLCSLWNGSIRGGYPALAEIQGSFLHPVVAISTLIWGVVNGVKVTLIVTLWIAGLAQWWIAHELKLSWLPRLWSALIAMAGGYLTGRMELGAFGILLSAATASLVFAGVLHLENQRSIRSAVILGVVGAITIISGQGYSQAALIVILPAAVVFLIGDRNNPIRLWNYYLLAGILGLMLAAHLLIPLFHFSPNMMKEFDTDFNAAQPLKYMLVNLVVDDPRFHYTEILGKLPYPHLSVLYIGWIPVFLAMYGISKIKAADWRIFGFLILGIVLAFSVASGLILKPLAALFPVLGGLRHPTLIAGLAVPLILGLSAYGLENLLKIPWPKIFISNSESNKGISSSALSLQWFILLPLLLINVKSNYMFAKSWFYFETRGSDFYGILDALQTETSQWVDPPYGEHGFLEPAIAKGYKVSPGILTWNWRGREFPGPKVIAVFEGTPPETMTLIDEVYGVRIFEDMNEEYAAVTSEGVQIPCLADSSGGLITAMCETETPGILTVKENMWVGWRVWVDDTETEFIPGSTWLTVKAPAGKHSYTFRYLPSDVLIGCLIFVVGVIISFSLWFRPDGKRENMSPPGELQTDRFIENKEEKSDVNPAAGAKKTLPTSQRQIRKQR